MLMINKRLEFKKEYLDFLKKNSEKLFSGGVRQILNFMAKIHIFF